MNLGNSKWILILGGGILSSPMYEKCKSMGLNILAFEWNLNAPALIHADEVMKVNLKDMDDVRRTARKANAKFSIAGVVTCGADIELAVATIAETLELPGIPVQVAMNCNNKIRMRKKLDEMGLGDTKWAKVESVDEAVSAAQRIGYPCFLKPADNCGSRGCKRINSAEDILNWWGETVKFSLNAGQCALLEEYQDGSRQTIEMIVYEDKIHLVSIIDTHYIYEEPEKYPFGNWPVETGLNTTDLSRDMQDRLFAHASQVVKAMGVAFGPVKVDTTISTKGIQTVELTARLSGGFHCQFATPLAYGTDEISAVAKMAIGEGMDLDLIRHKYDRAAVVQAKFPRPGRIVSIQGVKEAKSLPGIKEVILMRVIGDGVGPYRNSTDRVAFAIGGGETLTDARRNVNVALDTLEIVTE